MNAERVTYRTESGRARTIYLEGVQVVQSPLLGELLTGIEVDREGTPVYTAKVDEKRHIIGAGAILRRVPVVMSNTYGEYEEA